MKGRFQLLVVVLAVSNAIAVSTQAQEEDTQNYILPLQPIDQDGSASKTSAAKAIHFEDRVVYYPEHRPGYTGWVKLFQFGNGEIGLSFDEVRRGPNPHFSPIAIDFIEAAGAPYRFHHIFYSTAHPNLFHESVYMKSSNGGKTWEETGRAFSNGGYMAGYPDGRMVRFQYGQHHMHPERGQDRHVTIVEDSRNGGKTWNPIARLLPGFTFSPHRLRKLRDGSLVASGVVRPTMGPGGSRATRQTMYPGERDWAMLAALMFSPDAGYTWTGPHYVLQGVMAWEPDFVELSDGRLLMINSSIQTGDQTRQFVSRVSTSFVCDAVIDITGAGEVADKAQTGIVPETVDITPDGLIVGTRRGGAYTCSNDLGKTWHLIDNAKKCKYQPQLVALPDGQFLAAWHLGTDAAFGQQDMCIGLHSFRLQADLPEPTLLTLSRSLSPSGDQFINAHRARLTVGGNPVAGKSIELRIKTIWTPTEHLFNTTPIDEAKDVRTVITDENGVADFLLSEYDQLPDLYFNYVVQATFTPGPNDNMAAGKSVMYDVVAMAAKRNAPHAYHVYLANNVLFLSAPAAEKYPELRELVGRFKRFDEDATMSQWADAMGGEKRAREILDFLLSSGILTETPDGKYHWLRAVHCGEKVIVKVQVNDLEDYAI